MAFKRSAVRFRLAPPPSPFQTGKWISFAAAALFAACGSLSVLAADVDPKLAGINHILVIYLENHSFDNLYGKFPGVDGFASAKGFAPQSGKDGTVYQTLPQPVLIDEGSEVFSQHRKIIGEILHNYGTVRQLGLTVGVAYGTDLPQALSAVHEILQENPRVLKDPEAVVGISLLGREPGVLVVHPSLPVRSVAELIAYAKERPGQVNYGSAGNGGISHLVPEMFKSATGLFMVHIPYRGSAPAFTDLMAGQVQFMAESIPQAAQYHKQGKVRALAVTSRERSPALPDVPTVMESGIKNFEVVGFYGFLAPAGTPKEAVNKLSEAFKAVLSQPDIKTRMVAQGADPAFLGADDFAKFLAAELPRWASVVDKSGAKLD